jgi:hypothetical protein
MTLASGTRIGPYEILAPLGAGGRYFVAANSEGDIWLASME